jgi:hypothetical protein
MSRSDEPTKARRLARAIGAFLLFFAVNMIAGAILSTLILYVVASSILRGAALRGISTRHGIGPVCGSVGWIPGGDLWGIRARQGYEGVRRKRDRGCVHTNRTRALLAGIGRFMPRRGAAPQFRRLAHGHASRQPRRGTGLHA